MIIDYRNGTNTDHDAIDAATGEPLPEAYYYADDEAGIYRTYLEMPGTKGRRYNTYYFWHKTTHEPLPKDRRIFAGDPDEHDWEIAWAERQWPIRIVRRLAESA